MGELPKSSTYPYSSAPLSLPLFLSLSLSSLCKCLVDPPSRIFVSRQSIRLSPKVSSQFARGRIRGEEVSDIPPVSRDVENVFHASIQCSPREKRIHRLFPKCFETRCRASKQASKRPGAAAGLSILHSLPHSWRGRGARRCDTESLEIRLQIYSSRHSRLEAERKLTGPFTNPEIIDDGDDLVEGLFPDVDHLNPRRKRISSVWFEANQVINFS